MAAVGRLVSWALGRSGEPGGSVESLKQRGAGWTWWTWWGRRDACAPVEEFWPAQEKLLPEEAAAAAAAAAAAGRARSRWWSRFIPSLWFGSSRSERAAAPLELEAELSDYGTPPPSPPPSPSSSPFRLFVRGLGVEVLSEHYDICFNLLRHLFDLCVVSLLRAAGPPARLLLEAVGVRGPLKLWLHGMALFMVSAAGMAGLLWLVQEYLPQLALVYGVGQALVISVSVRQSVLLEDGADPEEEKGEEEDTGAEPRAAED